MALKARRRVRIRRSPRRPILNGLARIFDFTGSLNVPAKSLPPHVADRYALWSDWKAVGDDLRTAMGKSRHYSALNHHLRSGVKND